MTQPGFYYITDKSPFEDEEKGEDSFVTDIYEVEVVPHGPAPMCPKCKRYIGRRQWNPPFEVELDLWGKGYPDLIQDDAYYFLATKRFKHACARYGMKGFSVWDPVKVAKVRRRKRSVKHSPPRYYRTVVAQSKTVIDQDMSEFEFTTDRDYCSECLRSGILKRWKRVVLKPNTWDGLDVFRACGMSSATFCTERFKVLCDELGIRNLKFVPTEEYAQDFYPNERDGFLESVQHLMEPADEQEAHVRSQHAQRAEREHVKWRLATPFIDWFSITKGSLDQKTHTAAARLNEYLEELRESDDADVWTIEALFMAPEWVRIRQLASEVWDLLGRQRDSV